MNWPVPTPVTDARGGDARAPVVNVPLWSHQSEAIEQAEPHQGFLLAHDMGCRPSGKSATAIALLEVDHAKRVLILCPKNVIGVWPAQLDGPLDPPGPPDGFSPRDWHIWAGEVQGARGPKRNPSVTDRALALMNADTGAIKLGRPFAAIVNYEASHLGDMRELILGTPWDAVICDESHRLKLPSGKASRLAANVAERCRARGGRVLALTGTPMPHTPLDVWAQLRVIDGGQRLGTSYRRFCAHYGAPETIYTGPGIQRTIYKELRPDRLDEFTSTVGAVMHRVAVGDVLDLPESTDRHVPVTLEPASRRAYDELERHGITEAQGGTLTAANAMVLVLRLAQATSGFGTDADTGAHVPLNSGRPPEKARALADLLEDLPTDEPVVVFCRFHADLDAVRQVAARAGRTYGELSGRRRDALADGATLNPDVGLAGVQLQAGGVGISLTRARHAVYYSLDFRLADYLQTRARLVRPGQDRNVVFFHLIASGTVDSAIYGALAKRQEVIDIVIAHLSKGATP